MSSRKLLESIIPLMLVLVLAILLFPMPGWFLDFCLAINIVIAFVILFVSLFVEKPVEFSVYPSLLLITTVFRLALNVATTRRILLNGHEGLDVAGQLIMAFGQFLIQGNFVVGLIIFLIISIINLKVITKGAGRIAEVAARFTLDALPGKQMSIDSDLSAGIITEQEARERRKMLARESEFYGAMDGAAKFVSGEALTGIFIMLLNIIGGFLIGYFQHSLSLGEAAQTFTILTVGDGLLSQIPAIIISISAGLIVSRAASGEQFSLEILSQIGRTIWPLAFAGIASVMLGLLPGLPFLPFLLVGSITGVLALIKARHDKLALERKKKQEKEKEASPDASRPVTTEQLLKILEIPSITVRISLSLGQIIGSNRMNEILRKIRIALATEYGFICPQVIVNNIPDDRHSPFQPMKIYIKDSLVADIRIDPNRILALRERPDAPPLQGTPCTDPSYRLDGYWINKSDTLIAKQQGYSTADAASIVMTAIQVTVVDHMHELIRRQDVHLLLSKIQKEFPKLVEEVTPIHLSLAQIHMVLSNLLYEYISIKDMYAILEALGEVAPLTKNIEVITEYVRKKIIKHALFKLNQESQFLSVITIEPELEERIRASIIEKDDAKHLALDPKTTLSLVNQLNAFFEQITSSLHMMTILASSDIRRPLAKFVLQRFRKSLVISPDEIPPKVELHSMGVLKLQADESDSKNIDSARTNTIVAR